MDDKNIHLSKEDIAKLLAYCEYACEQYNNSQIDNSVKHDYANGVSIGMFMAFQIIVDILRGVTPIPVKDKVVILDENGDDITSDETVIFTEMEFVDK